MISKIYILFFSILFIVNCTPVSSLQDNPFKPVYTFYINDCSSLSSDQTQNNDGSIANPFCSFSEALQKVKDYGKLHNKIIVLGGTYYESINIDGHSNLTIEGSGNGSIIVGDGSSSEITYIHDSSNIKISKLSFELRNTTSSITAINIGDGQSSITLQDLSISFNNSYGGSFQEYVGIEVGSNNSQVSILSSSFDNIKSSSIKINESSTINISGNTFKFSIPGFNLEYGLTMNGFITFNSLDNSNSSTEIYNNSFEMSQPFTTTRTFSAILSASITYDLNMKISGNSFYGSTYSQIYGIFLYEAHNAIITLDDSKSPNSFISFNGYPILIDATVNQNNLNITIDSCTFNSLNNNGIFINRLDNSYLLFNNNTFTSSFSNANLVQINNLYSSNNVTISNNSVTQISSLVLNAAFISLENSGGINNSLTITNNSAGVISSTGGMNAYGIRIANYTNAGEYLFIDSNTISSMQATNSNATGIAVGSMTSSSSIIISNNDILNLELIGTSNQYGIDLASVTCTSTCKVNSNYLSSISMTGGTQTGIRFSNVTNSWDVYQNTLYRGTFSTGISEIACPTISIANNCANYFTGSWSGQETSITNLSPCTIIP
jgi:hypothetical protein